MESTYEVSRHEERLTREARLTSKVREIIARGGRVLMPVVALGRAQVSSASPSISRAPILSPANTESYSLAMMGHIIPYPSQTYLCHFAGTATNDMFAVLVPALAAC